MKPFNSTEVKIIRERQRQLMNRKYRMDLYWIILFTLTFLMGIYFISVYTPIVFTSIDETNPLVMGGIVIAACLLMILILKALERKLF